MSNGGSLSFPRTRRLKRDSDFDLIKARGYTVRGTLMMLAALTVQRSPAFRAGFVTSRRVGSAVVRNRVRRRLKEIVRAHQDEVRPDVWIVLIAKSGAATASYRAMEDEWLRLGKRASILAL